MKKIQFPKISESFPARLSFLLILITSAVFIVSFIAYYQSARIQVKAEAVQHAERSLETVVLRIDQVLQSVEIAVNNMTWNVNEYINTPDSLYSLTTQLLKNNSHIVGSAIAFDPLEVPDADTNLSADKRNIGGLGIYLIKQIMDDVKYMRIDNKNILVLKKVL